MEDTFHSTGFSNWNDPGRAMSKHIVSDLHKELQSKLFTLENSTPISAILNKKEKESRLKANQQLVIVIRALQLLSRQNLALRGNTMEVSFQLKLINSKTLFLVIWHFPHYCSHLCCLLVRMERKKIAISTS